MQLHEIPRIRLDIEMRFCHDLQKNELERLLRMFKPHGESLESDCIYSPCFDVNPLVLGDDFGERCEMLRRLTGFIPKQAVILRISYDYAFTPVRFSYRTDKEFGFIGGFLERMLEGTNLSLLMLLSHFNQFGNKLGTVIKPEHYHAVIGNIELSEPELDCQADRLLLNFKNEPLIRKVYAKGK